METNEKKAKILDRHLKVRTLDNLADYLEEYFERDKNTVYGFSIEATNDEMIIGMIGSSFYTITYEYGKRASITIDQNSGEALSVLEKVMAPLMWKVRKNSLAPVTYCSPILRYSTPACDVVEWETFDPVSKLKSVAFEVFTNKTQCYNVQVLHPTLKLEDFREYTYFGNMDAFVPPEIQEEVDNFTEFELYYNIKQLYEFYNYYEKLEAGTEEAQEEKQERIMYNIDYLLRKTENYGIKAFEPSPEPFNLTVEQMAWFSWWDEAFTKLLSEKPWTLQEWKKYPRGFDPDFRPQGSYKRYLPPQEESQDKE